MSGEHEYRPDGQLPAFNPIDGQNWTAIIRENKAEVIRKRGMGPARELAEIVPPTLRYPNAVFRGLRDKGASNWLCYVGSPTKAYDYEKGQRVLPWPGEVFLVFVNDQRVVYNWGWEKADPADPKLPKDFETRFLERLEYRNEP